MIRALFVWEAPPPPPSPLTLREVMLLVDVDLGVWSGIDPDCVLGREIAAALAKRDALEEAKRAPPPPFKVDIPIQGHGDGLVWGVIDAHPDASEWRALLVPAETPPVGSSDVSLFAEHVRFLRHRFRGAGALAVFVRDGIDVERVAAALFGGAS